MIKANSGFHDHRPGSKPQRSCAYCGGRAYRHWWTMASYDIGRCADCGLVQVTQETTDEELAKIYGEGFYTGENELVYEDYMARAERKLADFGRRLDHIVAQNGITRPGRCLEVGCAFGLFLVAARNRGWQVRGTELSSFAAGRARETYGLDVSDSPDALRNIESASHDLVVMWDVIEHLREPLEVLKEVRRILVNNGLLVFRTGDISSLGARFYGKNWFLVKPPYHLFYFDHATVTKMLQTAGFTVRQIRNGGGHPLENRGLQKFKLLQWIARHDRYIGWRFRSGPVMNVTAIASSTGAV